MIVTEIGLVVSSSLSFIDEANIAAPDTGAESEYLGFVVDSINSLVNQAAVDKKERLPAFILADSTFIPRYDMGVTANGKSYIDEAFIDVSDSGDVTASRLAAPSGKTTADFRGGRIADDTNPLYPFDGNTDKYREDELCIKATTDAATGKTFKFRVILAGGTEYNTYNVIAKWTISAGGTIYNDTVTLTTTAGMTHTCSLNMFPSLIAAITAGLTRSATLDMFPSLTLATTVGLLRACDLIMQLALTSAVTAGFNNAGSGKVYSDTLTLNANQAFSDIGGLSLSGSLTLAETNGFTVANTLSITGLLTLAVTTNYIITALMNWLGNLTLVETSGFTPANNINMATSALSLASTETFNGQAGFTFNLVLTLAAALGFTPAVFREINPSVTFGTTEGFTRSVTQGFFSPITFSETSGFSASSRADLQAIATILVNAGFSSSSIGNLVNTLTLMATAGMTPAVGNSIQALRSLAVAVTFLGNSFLGNVYTDIVNMVVHPSMVQFAGFDYINSLILNTNMDAQVKADIRKAFEIVSVLRYLAEDRKNLIHPPARNFVFKSFSREFAFKSREYSLSNIGPLNRIYQDLFVDTTVGSKPLSQQPKWIAYQKPNEVFNSVDGFWNSVFYVSFQPPGGGFGGFYYISTLNFGPSFWMDPSQYGGYYRTTGVATYKFANFDWPTYQPWHTKIKVTMRYRSTSGVDTTDGFALAGPTIQTSGVVSDTVNTVECIAAVYRRGFGSANKVQIIQYKNATINILATLDLTLASNDTLILEHDKITGNLNLYVADILKLQINYNTNWMPGRPGIFGYKEGTYASWSFSWFSYKAELT